MGRERINVLIVDDHPVFREGLRQCLEARKELQVNDRTKAALLAVKLGLSGGDAQ